MNHVEIFIPISFEAFLHEFTQTQDALGFLYRIIKVYDKSEKFYKDVLQVYEQLAEKYPKVYLSEVIRTLKNLRKLYNESERPEEVEKLSKKINDLKKRQTI